MMRLPNTVPIPAPDPATPTVAAPAPMNLAAVSMSRLRALVRKPRSATWDGPRTGATCGEAHMTLHLTKVVKSIDTTILFRYHAFKTIRSPLIIHSIVYVYIIYNIHSYLQSDKQGCTDETTGNQLALNLWLLRYSLQQRSDVTW